MSERILVVDDDEGIRQLVRRLLERAGFSVDTAVDGVQALDRLGEADYALILLDMMMPRMSGFELIAHLRERRPDMLTRVLVLTATSPRVLETIDADDLAGVLRKPFDIQELVAQVRACVERGEGDKLRACPT